MGINPIRVTINGHANVSTVCLLPPKPASVPMNVELARAIAKASGTSWENHGNLSIAFADFTLKFIVAHQHDEQGDKSQEAQKYIEVAGLTGVAWKSYERKQLGHLTQTRLI